MRFAVVYCLRRFKRPASFLCVVELVVRHRADNASFQRSYGVSVAADKALVIGVECTALDGITDIVVEKPDLAELVGVPLIGELIGVYRRFAACPALAVHKDPVIYLVKLGTDSVHSLDVVQCHKVEAEAVDMILLDPEFERVDDELSHH